jgi:hypothetical protein
MDNNEEATASPSSHRLCFGFQTWWTNNAARQGRRRMTTSAQWPCPPLPDPDPWQRRRGIQARQEYHPLLLPPPRQFCVYGRVILVCCVDGMPATPVIYTKSGWLEVVGGKRRGVGLWEPIRVTKACLMPSWPHVWSWSVLSGLVLGGATGRRLGRASGRHRVRFSADLGASSRTLAQSPIRSRRGLRQCRMDKGLPAGIIGSTRA